MSAPYPPVEFPGFEACIKMLHDPDPMTHEGGHIWLMSRVEEFRNDLIKEFKRPENHTVAYCILELITEDSLPQTIDLVDFFAEQLRDPRNGIRELALFGLTDIGTRPAIEAMKDALQYEFASAEATAEFRAELEIWIDDCEYMQNLRGQDRDKKGSE